MRDEKNMNKVILMGRLTKAPDLRYTSGSNKAVASFTLAVNRRGAKEQQADFINIVAWENTAEFVGKYYTKGLQVAVVGRIQTRTWDDSEGRRHYITEVVTDETYFADRKKDGEEKGDAYEGSSDGYYPLDEDQFPSRYP